MKQLPDGDFQSGGIKRHYFALTAIAFMAIAVYGSFVPLSFRELSISQALARFRQIPFLALDVESRADWAANILLFVPLGYLWLGALSVGHARSVAIGWALLLVPALTTLSVAIEFTQLWFPDRTVSQNDIVAESIGGLIGATIWVVFGNRVTKWIGVYVASRRPDGQIAWLLQAYLAGFILYSILPLDLTISVAEMGRKYREGRISLVPFADQSSSFWHFAARIGQDILLTVPIGALAGIAWLRPTAGGWSIVRETLAGTVVIALIELAQVFVFSRTASVTDILLGGVGVAIGVGAGRFFLQECERANKPACGSGQAAHVRRLVPLICFAYAALIMLFAWIPFDFIGDAAVVRERFTNFVNQVPGATLYAGTDFNAMDQIFKRFVIYAPIGYLIGFWSTAPRFSVEKRRFALGIGLVSIAGVALIGEIGQIFLASRVADVTEIFLCLASAIVGAIISIRLHAGKVHISDEPEPEC